MFHFAHLRKKEQRSTRLHGLICKMTIKSPTLVVEDENVERYLIHTSLGSGYSLVHITPR